MPIYAKDSLGMYRKIAHIYTSSGEELKEVRTNSGLLVYEMAKPAVVHYGFKIDKSQTDPDNAVIYTNGAVGMTPAHMNFTTGSFDYGSWENAWFIKNSYPVALNFDGTEAYILDPDDYTKRLDGTDSDIQYVLLDEKPSDWSTQWKQYYHIESDSYVKNSSSNTPTFEPNTYYKLTSLSSAVNYMVAFPKVYFKRYEDEDFNYIEISDRKLGSDFKAYAHINIYGQEVDYIYLPLFKGSIVDSKLRSIPGATPSGGTTATAELNAVNALGPRWQYWDHSSREMICDLLTLIGRNTDSQSVFGRGQASGYNSADTVTYGKLQTGTLLNKGQFFGYSNSTSEVKAFHIEGLWGNRWDRILGMLLIDGAWNIKMTPSYNFTGSNFTILDATPSTTNNYLRTISTSEYGSVPATVSESSNSPFGDYFYQNQSETRVALVGGNCNLGAYCGFRFVNVSNAASRSDWHIGASPVYK